MAKAAENLSPGATWRRGRYRIVAPIGLGGQGQTLLAEDRVTARQVVLKYAAPRDDSVAREFRELVELDHPNVVAVFDLYVEPLNGALVLVEEFIAGAALGDRLGRLSAVEIQKIGADLVAALAQLQAAEIRHGDIKPANVMLRGSGESIEALLVDFGFASSLRAESIPGGTPAYFAPELRGGELSTATDLWALGLTLAQMTSGSPLPPEGAALELLRRSDAGIEGLLLDDPGDRLRAFASLVDETCGASLPERLPFVGRADELARLASAVVGASEMRAGAVIDVVAPPGRGASRLIETLVGRLGSAERSVVFRGDWFDPELMLREVAVELGEDFDLSLPEERSASELAAFLWTLVRRRRPEGLLVVGLGRAAAESPFGRALIEIAGRQDSAADRRLVVLRAREPEMGEAELAALDSRDLVVMMRRLLPIATAAEAELVGRLAALMFEISAGHPALIDAFLREALATGALVVQGGGIRMDEDRMRALDVSAESFPPDDDARAVAGIFAANLGRLDRAALRELFSGGADRLERVLVRLRRAGFVRDPGGLDRPMIWVGPDFPGPIWAPSSPGADLVRLRERLSPWLTAAAPDALVGHLERGLDGRRGPEAAPVLFLLARALVRCGERRRALELIASLDDDERAQLDVRDLVMSEATIKAAMGRRDAALQALEEGLTSPGLGQDGRAMLLAEAAFIRLLAADSRAALRQAEEALQLAVDPATRARAATMAAAAARQTGDPLVALERFELAEAIFAELGDDRRRAALLANRAMADLDRGRPGRAARSLEEARRLLGQFGSVDQLAATALNLGVARQSLRDFVGAQRALGEAGRLFRIIGDDDRANASLAAQGIALCDGGEPVSGYQALRSARQRLEADAEAFLDNLSLRARLALELARAEFLSAMPGRARRRLRSVERERLDPQSRARLDTLELVLSGADLLAEETLAPPAIAAALRSRDLILRGLGLARALVLRQAQGRLASARRHHRRLLAGLRFQEKDMKEARRGLHRAGVSVTLFESLNRRLEIGLMDGGGTILAAVHDALAAVNEARDLEQALDAIARGVLGLGRALRVYILSWDGENAEVLAAARRDSSREVEAEISTLVLRRTAATGEPVVVADAGSDDLLGFAGSVRALGLRSVACFPLIDDDQRRILLYLDTPLASGAFDAEHLRALRTFAAIARAACSLHDRALRGEAQSRAARNEVASVRGALRSQSVELERLRERAGFGRIVGNAPALRELVQLIHKVAPTDISVLITGETGSGKELVAQAIHSGSTRAQGPFVAINCANINPMLAESELFGHRRGAFTGATENREGLFVVARGGTVFLDEVGELPLELQAKLLRVLETRELRPVGGEESVAIDLRVVAATNRDVRDDKEFRPDLYFRLAQIELAVPPLRERRDDIPLLVRHILTEKKRGDVSLEAEAMAALQDFEWPGNIRQLRNVIERCLLLVAENRIQLTDLPEEIWSYRGRKPATLAEIEADAIRAALKFTGGEKKAAAALLGISRTAIYEKLRRLGPDFA